MRCMRSRDTLPLQAIVSFGLALGLSASAFAEPPMDPPEGPSEPPEERAFPIVSLSFDDSHEEHAWAAQILSQMGMVGTFYVNSPRLGDGGYLRVADLHAMEALGHEIGGHTLNHEELAKLGELEQFHEICADRDALLALGLSVRALAYPFNNYAPSTIRIAQTCGYASARTAAGITAPGYCQSCPHEETLPPPDPFSLRTFPSVKRSMGAQTLIEAIQDAEDGGWLIFVFHEICDTGCSTYSTLRADFLALLDWMRLHRVRTRTVSEMVLGETPPVGPCVDIDGDGLCREQDNCPADANADQADSDGDGLGDACDPCPFDPENDADGDGVCAPQDNCPAVANPDQEDADGDGAGDACDVCAFDPEDDVDGDGICGDVDNCNLVANPDQADADEDGQGDACDICVLDPENDADGDGLCESEDNCPTLWNPVQADADGDGQGDACDACSLDPQNDADGDGICGNRDNCSTMANPDQADANGNGVGDVCDDEKPLVPTDPKTSHPGPKASSSAHGNEVGCSSAGAEPGLLSLLLIGVWAIHRRRSRTPARALAHPGGMHRIS